MRVTRTFTFSVERDGLTIGPALGISEEKSRELWERAMKVTEKAETTGELINALMNEFDGNEFLYIFGFMWFTYGAQKGKADAMAEMMKSIESGRFGQ